MGSRWIRRLRHSSTTLAGFTLVEMLVVAPIVILAIGAFIVLIVSLTGEVMSSRGSNLLAYNIQDTLSRIEEDVRLSAGYLSKNDIALTSTNPQGRNTGDTLDTTTDFTLLDSTYGQSLILKSYVTSGNPVSLDSGLLYLADRPSACTSYAAYSHNVPMAMNIVYFVDDHDTLWRRTIMPADYADPNGYCGSNTPWQQPSCIDKPGRSTFCKTNDQKMLENVSEAGFSIAYFTSASATTPLAISSSTDDAALESVTTVAVSLSASNTLAGREVSRSGLLRVSRLDLNASAVSDLHTPTAVPGAPTVASSVSEGHRVTFTWPVVPTATNYSLQYRVNGGSWSSAVSISSADRHYTVTTGWNGDTVEARVTAANEAGPSTTYGTNSITIPLWAPLVLINGWTNYESTYAPASYTRTSAGVVLLRGLIKGGTIGDIATLPEDYRPSKDLIFENSSNQVASRLDIRTNGVVNMPVGSNAWASLDGTNFMAGNVYTNFSSFSNSWQNYGGSWGSAGYAVDSLGRVHTSGLVSSGTIADNTVIATLPAAYAPAGYMHVANGAANAHGLIGVNTSSQLVAKGYSNAYISFNSMFYPATARASGSTCTTQWCNLSLKSGWVHYAAPFTTPQYTKSPDNIVIVKGLVRSGDTARDIASLPQGFCPAKRLLMTIGINGGWGRVDIVPEANPANGCTITPSAVNASWTSLDSLIFVAEQ